MFFLREIRTSTLFPSERLLLEFVTLGRVPPKAKTSIQSTLEPIWRDVPQLATDGRGAAWMAGGALGQGKDAAGRSSLFNRLVTDPVFVVLLCATLAFVSFVARLYRKPDHSLVTMAAMLETEGESEKLRVENPLGVAPVREADPEPEVAGSFETAEFGAQPGSGRKPGTELGTEPVASNPAEVREGGSVRPSTSSAVSGMEKDLKAGVAVDTSDDKEQAGLLKPIPFVLPEDKDVGESAGRGAIEPVPTTVVAAPEVTAASLFKAKRVRPSRGPVGG